jgi:uncharacterized protein YfaP (DUF2135 family)
MNSFYRLFHRIIWLSIAILLALTLYGTERIALAQGTLQNTRIRYGETVTGRITRDSFRTIYTFDGRQGDIIDVKLTRTAGNLDPILILTDDQNRIVARDDDSASGYNAALISQQLPRDGIYFLIVSRFGQEHGLTTGDYSLTLVRVGLIGGTGATLEYGDSVVAELNNEQYQQVYVFRGERGDIVRASMQRISGDLDALLILADSQGNVLIVNDEDPASPGTLDAAIHDLRIVKTDNYLLVATRFGREAGQSRGGFSLNLERLPPETLGKVPEKAILLDYGAVGRGTIDGDTVMRFYMIQSRKGDILTLNVERTRGNLDPILALYTSDLKELATNDASGVRGQNARIANFAIPADGAYIIMVSRFNRDKGITTGDYALTITGLIGVTVGGSGKATLQYNNAANAIIDDNHIAQEYTFSGAAGEVINITMDTTSGNLLTQIVLIDPAQKQLAVDDPGSGSARITRFRLPSNGTYTILATRRGRDKGVSRGAYILILTRAATR